VTSGTASADLVVHIVSTQTAGAFSCHQRWPDPEIVAAESRNVVEGEDLSSQLALKMRTLKPEQFELRSVLSNSSDMSTPRQG
jgi:hypothetical protein